MKTLLYPSLCLILIFSSHAIGQCDDPFDGCNPDNIVNLQSYYFSPIDFSSGVVQSDPNPSDYIGPEIFVPNAGCDADGNSFDAVLKVEQLTNRNTGGGIFDWKHISSVVRHQGLSSTWYRFTVEFYRTGTSIPVTINSIQEISDIDGNCDINNDNQPDIPACNVPTRSFNSDYIEVYGYDWYYTQNPSLIYNDPIGGLVPNRNLFLSAGTDNFNYSSIDDVSPGFAELSVVFSWLNKSSVYFDYYTGQFGGLQIDFTTNFSVDNPCSTLPVSFEDISVTAIDGDEIVVKWKTSTALNGLRYELEYSTDGINYDLIANIPFDQTRETYSYIHKNLETIDSEVHYYRITFLDKNGLITKSPVATLSIEDDLSQNAITFDQVTKKLIMNGEFTHLSIFDLNGRIILSNKIDNTEMNQSYSLSYLHPGLYFVITNTSTTKIIIL